MMPIRVFTASLSMVACLAAFPRTQAGDPYAGMLDELRSEIVAKLPAIDGAARHSITEAKDAKARVEAVRRLAGIDAVLAGDALDSLLAKCFVLHEATPSGLAAFAGQGPTQRKLIDAMLADDELLLEIAVADGCRPVHANGKSASPPNYGKAMEILAAIQHASPKAKKGLLQRLTLAVALEFSEPTHTDDSKAIDPVNRYLHFEKAFEAGELDPSFDRLTVWEMRFVVCAPESDEALAWGRDMLRNYRPDHILTDNEGGRYANLVNTDVRYGSLDVRNDRPELWGVQNILMNGGICGRRAFFARFICRAFGIPATPRPSNGHGASARWTPQGWVVVLGPGWGHGWTSTRYRNDLDFLATTQARGRGEEFLRVKRAQWIGDATGEPPAPGEHGKGSSPGFWNGVALATQERIIEESKAVALDAIDAELGEANGPTMAQGVLATTITAEDRTVVRGEDGSITIPAVAYTQAGGGAADEEEVANDVLAMKSFSGGMQVFLPRFFQQEPILVRGGSWRHDASSCQSATRHWRGRRPKKSQDLRGLRLAVTPDGDDPQKELELDLGGGATMAFVYIPPGSYIMGGDRKAKEGDVLADTPKHEVRLTRGFYLGKYEVTQAQYQAITGTQRGQGPDHPADGVKPFTALRFCDDLSARIGLEVRLPTEAEWEYAARGGTDTIWFFGDDPSQLGDHAWFKDNAGGKTHPVGRKKPNPWGLFDIYGNVAEFVRDEHQEDYYAKSPKTDPVGPLLGIHSSMRYAFNVPQSGEYTLTAQVVTSNVKQSLQLAVNGAGAPITVALPFTIGMWGQSEPVTLSLVKGENTLQFWRDQAPQYGVAVKSFTLRPRRTQPRANEPDPASTGMLLRKFRDGRHRAQ
jgi:formylglycine-generating enzyme required for sulfatase activity